MDARRVAGAAAPRPGALERWKAEIRAGTRANTIQAFDDLAAAAANEAAGLERLNAGDIHGARYFFDCARLRLLGCYLHPGSDKAKALLKEGASREWAENPASVGTAPAKPENPWAGLRLAKPVAWVSR
jgi:hypothetical protein